MPDHIPFSRLRGYCYIGLDAVNVLLDNGDWLSSGSSDGDHTMLVLTRKYREKLVVEYPGGHLVLSIERINGKKVRVGIKADRNVRVIRPEAKPLPPPIPPAGWKEVEH